MPKVGMHSLLVRTAGHGLTTQGPEKLPFRRHCLQSVSHKVSLYVSRRDLFCDFKNAVAALFSAAHAASQPHQSHIPLAGLQPR